MDLTLYAESANDRIVISLRPHLREDIMIKLSNSDGRFVVQLLELRRAAILEMTQRLPEQSCKERTGELGRLDTVLTQIKAELPQDVGGFAAGRGPGLGRQPSRRRVDGSGDEWPHCARPTLRGRGTTAVRSGPPQSRPSARSAIARLERISKAGGP
jgi:hypothetical protein